LDFAYRGAYESPNSYLYTPSHLYSLEN